MAAAVPPPDVWKKSKTLEYTIQREYWGQYEVEEAVNLRARTVLLSLQRIPGEGGLPSSLAPTSAVLVAVEAPFKMRGPPTDPAGVQQKVEAAKKVEVEWKTIEEPWNEYLFDDSGPKLLRLKLVVSGVTRAEGVYDGTGAPIYLVSHATVVAPPLPRKVIPGK